MRQAFLRRRRAATSASAPKPASSPNADGSGMVEILPENDTLTPLLELNVVFEGLVVKTFTAGSVTPVSRVVVIEERIPSALVPLPFAATKESPEEENNIE